MTQKPIKATLDSSDDSVKTQKPILIQLDDIPTPTDADAGKVLGVDDEGKYALTEGGGGGSYIITVPLDQPDDGVVVVDFGPAIPFGEYQDLIGCSQETYDSILLYVENLIDALKTGVVLIVKSTDNIPGIEQSMVNYAAVQDITEYNYINGVYDSGNIFAINTNPADYHITTLNGRVVFGYVYN